MESLPTINERIADLQHQLRILGTLERRAQLAGESGRRNRLQSDAGCVKDALDALRAQRSRSITAACGRVALP
jgi:hypothetical protein